MKLASENIGHAFVVKNKHLSVINLRLGTVRLNQEQHLINNTRFMKTWLSHKDLVNLFKRAIETDVNYGTYYGVSDNEDAIWDITNAINELGYKPIENSNDILNKTKD